MTSQLQQPESSVDTNLPTSIEAATPVDLPKLPPAKQSDEKWQHIVTTFSNYLGNLPDNTGRFFNEYRQPITNVVLILVTLISLRVVLAVLDALDAFPMVLPTFELIGIGYSIWFVKRYLLTVEDRRELFNKVEEIKNQFFSNEQLPNSEI